MKILFIMAHGYLPQRYGGLQIDVDRLCRELNKRGHETVVLASLMHGGVFGLISRIKLKAGGMLFGRRLTRDRRLGYTVWRTWFPWGRPDYEFPRKEICYVIGKEKPDLVVVASGDAVRIALTAKETGVPVLMMLADVEFQDHGGSFTALGDIPCVANSKFTADKHRRSFGVDPAVIHPLIPHGTYKTDTTRENVTFINPSPHKGFHLALDIARLCPEIPFVFNECWPLKGKERQDFMQKLAPCSNVALVPPQEDMRKIYGKCKILLAPSVWEEAYGRIATEAQLSGIPVIASTRGGLPEAVGPGGILLNLDSPLDEWVNAVRNLWQDESYYAAKSVSALAYAQRPEMNLAHQIEAWEKAMQAAIGRRAKNKA